MSLLFTSPELIHTWTKKTSIFHDYEYIVIFSISFEKQKLQRLELTMVKMLIILKVYDINRK